MKVQALDTVVENQILKSYTSVNDWQAAIPFCVDGRDGEVEYADGKSRDHLFVQSLGGVIGIATVQFMASSAEGYFLESFKQTLNQLNSSGFTIGVHRDSHAHDDVSGCGYADNLPTILRRLGTNSDEIKDIINAVAPGVIDDVIWSNVVNDSEKAANTSKHTSGEDLIAAAIGQGAHLQVLEGSHEERAAVVNLAHATTLDTKSLVDDSVQAFNLDVWYVREQAKALSLNSGYTTHAILGLYVATEMILVEDKKNVRLPVLVRA